MASALRLIPPRDAGPSPGRYRALPRSRTVAEEAYTEIAGNDPTKLVLLTDDPKTGCACEPDDKGKPVPVPVPVPAPQKQKEEDTVDEPSLWPGLARALAVTALVAGTIAAGAALVATAPAWVPAAAGVAIVGGLAGLAGSSPSSDGDPGGA